ncbi:hypothetical protein [Streptomyces sp. NPDC101455]|uniref:hypothetical protein n=1 Tax=Streptomyces sp. NPDC101455 TaxID=3366142 RepID=UPI0037F2085A
MDRTQQDIDALINAASPEQLREFASAVFGITHDAKAQPTTTDYDFGGDAHSDAIVDAKFSARHDLAMDIENDALKALTSKVIETGKDYVSIDGTLMWEKVTVRGIWLSNRGKRVAFEIHRDDWRGQGSPGRRTMSYDLFVARYNPS